MRKCNSGTGHSAAIRVVAVTSTSHHEQSGVHFARIAGYFLQ